ncbi:hypothetical protein [Gemmobacter nectariphilus]|uniref:hypothetical protein n=1 Tax=Gemmobacter nectariphilus TaxID=220343 RepID=UPI000418D403|nr:hypothetical protein [Gemmobacter nectariphilus]
MRRVVWGLVGLIGGGAIALAAGLAAAEMCHISQAEGAYAMGLVFFWVPLGSVIGAIAGAVLGARKAG